MHDGRTIAGMSKPGGTRGARGAMTLPDFADMEKRTEADNPLVCSPPPSRFLDLPLPQHSIFAFLLHSRRHPDSLEVVYKILANIEGEERDCVHRDDFFLNSLIEFRSEKQVKLE